MPGWYLFNSGLTAMRAQNLQFESISNNIANATTPGYKAAEVRFQDLVGAKNSGGTFDQLGGVQSFQQAFLSKEGIVSDTNRQLDAAISGSGYFVTNTAADGSGEIELTDAGSFDVTTVEENGTETAYLTDIKGNFLLGYNADPDTGDITVDTGSTAALEAINVTKEGTTLPASATTLMDIGGNLAPDTPAGDSVTFDFSVLDGSGDADGVDDERVVQLTFTKTANPNEWDMEIAGLGGTVTTPAIQPVTVTFDSVGTLQTIDGQTATTQAFSVDWTNPAVTTPMTLDIADFTQFAGESVVDAVDFDGNADGQLRDVFFNDRGQVVGLYDNGLSRPIAQLALGDVVNPDKMELVQQTHYRPSADSGEIQLFDFTATSRARFTPGALEQSTVDFATEFSNLIITQRAYSSAATTVRTVDEMTQTATQLKA